jgi:hypothetical protein
LRALTHNSSNHDPAASPQGWRETRKARESWKKALELFLEEFEGVGTLATLATLLLWHDIETDAESGGITEELGLLDSLLYAETGRVRLSPISTLPLVQIGVPS